MQKFEYSELDPRAEAIRVLTVLERNEDGIIECSLQHEDLSTTFSALSYTWGSPEITREISIDGKPFIVRQNLYDFLKTISEQTPRRRIWVDAICIDQANDEEKSFQVLQMGKIYDSAREVIVWLGDDPTLQNWFAALGGNLQNDDAANKVSLPMSRRAWLDGFKVLMLHKYWTRLWITQELLLARNAKLMAGKSLVSINLFRKQYEIYRIDARTLFDRNRSARIFSLLARKYQQKGRFRPNSLAARAAFEMTAESHCQDSRDRIFGVLSLIEGGESFPLNYADSRFTVFLRALVQFHDKYLSYVLISLLKPDLESIHADLKPLLQTEQHLDFDGVTLLSLQYSSFWSDLCHSNLRAEETHLNNRFICCIELLPKRNQQDKYLAFSSTLHIIFEAVQGTQNFRSTRAVCQRDIEMDKSASPSAHDFAEQILEVAKNNVAEGAVVANRPIVLGDIESEGRIEHVHMKFPLALLGQFFWYLLRPRLKPEDEVHGIKVKDRGRCSILKVPSS